MNALLLALAALAAQAPAHDPLFDNIEGDIRPDFESISERPIPEWFDDAKFGILVTWGLYSVPAWAPKQSYAERYWQEMHKRNSPTWRFHNRVYGEDFAYPNFAPRFTAELFEAEAWARLFQRAGAKYVVLTSKHHDGFTLWPSAESWNWNSADIGPRRDLCAELLQAVRARGMKMGFYYSLLEWRHPLYQQDFTRYVREHMLPQMMDLVERYRPDILWAGGEWDHPARAWRSAEFLAWLFNTSRAPKDIVINDRWGNDTRSRFGGFFTTEYGKHGRDTRQSLARKWEESRGIGGSFGYNRNETLEDYATAPELVRVLVDTVSDGGNLLLGIGPAADGRIPVIMEKRLLEIGAWLETHGEAIYGTRRWEGGQNTNTLRFTAKPGDIVYAIAYEWPETELVVPKAAPRPVETADADPDEDPAAPEYEVATIKQASLVGSRAPAFEIIEDAFNWRIQIPEELAAPSNPGDAWAFKLELNWAVPPPEPEEGTES